MPCFVNNPENNDNQIKRNYKTKEKNVVDKIKESFPDFTWVSDKKFMMDVLKNGLTYCSI
jgi:hypothetical protein